MCCFVANAGRRLSDSSCGAGWAALGVFIERINGVSQENKKRYMDRSVSQKEEEVRRCSFYVILTLISVALIGNAPCAATTMSERKVLNKYFLRISIRSSSPARKHPKNSQQVVRLMAPFSCQCVLHSVPPWLMSLRRCNTCGESSTRAKSSMRARRPSTARTTSASRYFGSTSNGPSAV